MNNFSLIVNRILKLPFINYILFVLFIIGFIQIGIIGSWRINTLNLFLIQQVIPAGIPKAQKLENLHYDLSKSLILPKNDIPLAYAFYQIGDLEKASQIISGKELWDFSLIEAYWYGLFQSGLGNKELGIKTWHDANVEAQIIDGARQLTELGKFSDAQKKYDLVLSVDSKNPKIWFEKGRMLWDWLNKNSPSNSDEQLTLISDIKDAFYRAVNLDPNNPDYLNWWGYYQFIYGNKPNNAIFLLEKAINIYPEKDEWVYYRLGLVYQSIGDTESAISAFQESYILDGGKNSSIVKELSKSYYEQKSFNEAVKYAEIAVKLSPNSADLHYLLAKDYASACDVENALRQENLAKKLDKDGKFSFLADQFRSAMLLAKECNSR